MSLHLPVLLNEVLASFADKQLKVFFDGTLGLGGHAEAILKAHPEIELFIGADQDATALSLAKERLLPWKDKTIFFNRNFEDFHTYLPEKPDGVLLDIGVSSMQLDRPERGFSFREDAPLDMRMDQSQGRTAADLLNYSTQQELEHIFRDFGEEVRWRRCADWIVKHRPIYTTLELKACLEPILGKKRFGEKEPVTKIFQALRIATNRELEVLERFLENGIDFLPSGGRLAIITFHSLEDRIVKETFRLAASDKWETTGYRGHFLDKEPEVKILFKKALQATDEEIDKNPRSRSAKLRVIEKL